MKKIAIVMDPIETIHIKKDTSFRLLLEATSRNYALYYLTVPNLFIHSGVAYGHAAVLTVQDNPSHWYSLGKTQDHNLGDFDVILMRKDPPFTLDYIYTTYILELAEKQGARVINKPQALRDCNEKLLTMQFPHCCPPTLVSSDKARLELFLQKEKDIVLKPLDGMGGHNVFRLKLGDPNTRTIIEVLTQYHRLAMAQRYLPEVQAGDKRILLIHGEPYPYALARMPLPGETRANLAAGGTGEGRALSARDYWLCEQIKPFLKERGLFFVGLDVIGDFITEINVTSPTCLRELETIYQDNIAGLFWDTAFN